MSSKKRDKGVSQRKTSPTTQDGEGFFRPFSNLPKPAAPKPEASRQPPPPPVRPKPKPNKAAPPSEDDLLTFDRLMGGVAPLDQRTAQRVPTSGAPATDRAREIQQTRAYEQRLEEDARARFRSLVDEGSRFEVVDDGRSIDGRRRGVDGGQVRRMKTAEVTVDATLDLHGMRLDQARDAVEAFVRDRRTRGDRVVLIVHGRGRNSPAGQSVLRGEVAAWLSEGKSSKHVAAFVTAPGEHGGEGALCVLLTGPDDRATRS